jgi:hypothetical protein
LPAPPVAESAVALFAFAVVVADGPFVATDLRSATIVVEFAKVVSPLLKVFYCCTTTTRQSTYVLDLPARVPAHMHAIQVQALSVKSLPASSRQGRKQLLSFRCRQTRESFPL